MNIYEVVNYFSNDLDGFEAREVLARYLTKSNAENYFWGLADGFGVSLEEGQVSFEKTTKGLAEDYYCLERYETDD